MITLDDGYIRMAEPDDAQALWRLYFDGHLRASLLDSLYERMHPTVDELHEMLGRAEITQGNLFAIEDTYGEVVGFCNLRGMTKASVVGDFMLMFHDPEQFNTPLADSIHQFAWERSFEMAQRKRIHAPCLTCETTFRAYLLRHGFESVGVQREVLHAQGAWQDLETFSLESPLWQATD